MKTREIVSKLYDLTKRGLFVNHQERELVKAAAVRLQELDKEKRELQARVTELEYLLKEREGIQAENDMDPFAVPPGEAAEDFWADDFWADDNCE